jgi:hypothetical protein
MHVSLCILLMQVKQTLVKRGFTMPQVDEALQATSAQVRAQRVWQ